MKKITYFLLVLVILNSQNILAKNKSWDVIYIGEREPIVAIRNENKIDTIVQLAGKSKLYKSIFNIIGNECAIINSIDEGDMNSYWYHLFIKNFLTGKWELVADHGIDVHLYRKGINKNLYKFVDTRHIEIYNEINKKCLLMNVSDNFKITFEQKRI
jgi:hypothetical protein